MHYDIEMYIVYGARGNNARIYDAMIFRYSGRSRNITYLYIISSNNININIYIDINKYSII